MLRTPPALLAAAAAARRGLPLIAPKARAAASSRSTLATAATAATAAAPVQSASRNHRVVVIGAGTAGLTISHQLLRTGRFAAEDIAVVDPAIWHHYQPGWTLVGGGLKTKEDLRRPLAGLLDPKLTFYNVGVGSFAPTENRVTLANGDRVGYEHLVVAPGIEVKFDSIKGLPEALQDPHSMVSSIYGYDYCDKVFDTIERFRTGTAIFTAPAGVIKCAGAPQKAMWLALDYWKKAGRYHPADPATSPIRIRFATGLPVMFGVPKYNATLEALRVSRGVDGLFQHDLVAIDGDTATFAAGGPDGGHVTARFDLLHVVPKMGPYAVVRDSPLADAAGFVAVDPATLRHPTFPNVWSAGDASSLPTSKTAAAVTAEAPVLVANLLAALDGRTEPMPARYDGYTSCPLLTEYGKVLLAEFGYGGVPKETFGESLGWDQAEPRRAFYYLKRDFFPWVYFQHMVKGTWAGPKGWRL